ncbi:MAG: glutaredoxin family protein [Chloroflexi bacterium]|nr:glutaredoxin family protein [Chloroflexota bacterium]
MPITRCYTLSYCPWCKRTKRFFTEHNIPFECIDYDLASPDEQARIEQEISAYSGGHVSFPYVVIGDEVVMGYDPERYRALLGLEEG